MTTYSRSLPPSRPNSTDGLQIHPTKTAILYSKPEGGGTFTIGGSEVACAPHKTHIGALGSSITFGEPTTAIMAEMARRGRHRSVLTAHTCLRTRLSAYVTLVRSSALYAAETSKFAASPTPPRDASHQQTPSRTVGGVAH